MGIDAKEGTAWECPYHRCERCRGTTSYPPFEGKGPLFECRRYVDSCKLLVGPWVGGYGYFPLARVFVDSVLLCFC